ncbi:MAG: type II toxin-antitoxin system VapC family toxin [Gaiellaceae bacterium]
MSIAYLDTSAFVKTIVREPQSGRLASWLPDWPRRASSELLRTEAVRAVRPHGLEAVQRARAELAGVDLIPVDRMLLDVAADIDIDIRSLDAIHLASALALGSDLGVLVTYDERMIRAASELAIAVASPAD